MKKANHFIPATIILCSIVLSLCTACTPHKNQPAAETDRETLYQLSTLNALMAGNYDGIESAADLAGRGDFGIGTFAGLDGAVYQIKDSGAVETPDGSILFPFLSVTYFDEDISLQASYIENYDALKETLDNLIEKKDRFYAIKVTGMFTHVHVRSVPRQEKPYPILSEITENQPEFKYENVEGTLVGFWCPDYVGSINVPGYHLHLISKDHTRGGHLLDVSFSSAHIALDETASFELTLAKQTSSNHLLDNAQDEIEKVEK